MAEYNTAATCRTEAIMFKKFGLLAVLMTILNLAFYGALGYGALWLLRHFGVI